MSTDTIARDLVALCKAGKFAEAGEKYWADNVVSVEATGDNPEIKGKKAAQGKTEWWENNHEVHSFEVEGPYVNGDQFVVRFKMDMTIKASGQRHKITPLNSYTNPATKETCSSFDEVSFGADGKASVTGSGRVCKGADGKVHAA